MSFGIQYVYPERMLKRARFIHLALPNTAWSLCTRARVGSVLHDEVVPDGWALCPRCLTRKKYLAKGIPFRRHHH